MPWQIVFMTFLTGCIQAFNMPARMSLINELAPPERLTNAIALNSSLFNLARLIGPAIAGITIAAVGAGICFLIDAFSYGAVIISLLMMRLPLPPKRWMWRDVAAKYAVR